MKKNWFIVCIFICILSILSGCSDKKETAQVSTDTRSQTLSGSNEDNSSWTVLVYLCGTDLETYGGYASVNIEEMLAANESENVNVIFQTGGTVNWQYDTINSEMLQRWEIRDNQFSLVDSQPLSSMGDANTFGEFLKWGVETYPAEKYMCLLWNHGGGSVYGIAADELYDRDALDLKELAKGLSMAGAQFELVGFDACLMSTLETAAAICPYAKYMVASQELEPGTGWDYTSWLSTLAANTNFTGLALGSAICDSFYEKCADNGTEAWVTLSVTDLTKIPDVVQKFDKVAAEMKGFTAYPDKLQPLTQAIIRAENYGGNNDNEGYTNMVDLGDMILCAEGVLTQTGDALLESIQAAVPHHVAGEGRQRSNGLSVYIPLGIVDEELDSYAHVAAVSGEYLRFLEGLFGWEVPEGTVIIQPALSEDQLPEEPSQGTLESQQVSLDTVTIAQALNKDDFELGFSMEVTDDGLIVLNIDKGREILRTVAFDLFYQDDESNSIWYLGSDYDVNESEDGNQYWDNFRNVWISIEGNFCMMQALSFTDEYILYTVPVNVNGKETNLRLIYHRDAHEYEVIGTWDGIDEETGMSGREVNTLKDGDEVALLFAASDIDSSEEYVFEGGSFIINGPILTEEAPLFDGTYYYQYSLTDIFGNEYESDLAMLTSLDGEISVQME